MKRHVNIPIFIPHLGCPNDCVFCNQRRITSHQSFDEDSVVSQIEEALSTVGDAECEIAFFGGSFTGIDRDLMKRLLKTGKSYIDAGRVSSLRCSTRPDYIDDEILEILRAHGMKTIELGIQSTDDSVLAASRRGHDSACAMKAMKAVKDAGFSLVGQMMTGLPCSTPKSETDTARDICRFADAARIYPIVVFKSTRLADMAEEGLYTPLSADELVVRSADVKEVFIEHGVPTIRIGLAANEGLTSADDIACGDYDGAVGERVEAEIYYRRLYGALHGVKKGSRVLALVPFGHISKACGHKKENKSRLISALGLKDIKFAESDLPDYSIKITVE